MKLLLLRGYCPQKSSAQLDRGCKAAAPYGVIDSSIPTMKPAQREEAPKSLAPDSFAKRKSTMVPYRNHRAYMVREAGLEPARPEWTLEPESSESANSTTRACAVS